MTSEIMPGGADQPVKPVSGTHNRARAARLARRAAQFNKFRLIQLNLVPLVDTFVSVVFFTLVTATVGELAPVVRVPYRDDPPFVEAINTPRLHAAFDLLAGRDRWYPRPNVGTFPIRFPHPGDPGDDGWHIDASFQPPSVDDTDFLHWRINVRSDGKTLLLLMLFSDVGDDDATEAVGSVGAACALTSRRPGVRVARSGVVHGGWRAARVGR